MRNETKPPLRSALALIPVGLLLAVMAVGPASAAETQRPVADLRGDSNRDGIVAGRTDDAGEARWDAERGAILLPNLDDDAARCKTHGANGRPLSDDLLAGCNDAADDKINSPADGRDLAPLRVVAWPNAPQGARATVSVDDGSRGKVRFFVKRGDRFAPLEDGRISGADLRRGVSLGVEARDVVRDTRLWDGAVDVTLTVRAGGQEAADRVRMRVAPVIFQHDLMGTNRLIAAPTGLSERASAGDAAASGPEDAALLPQRAARTGETLPEELSEATAQALPEETAAAEDPMEEWMRLFAEGERDFLSDLEGAVAEAETPQGLQRLEEPRGDIWAQDYFEPAYASMPAAGGRQQVVRIMVRSANAYPTENGVQLRPAGKSVFTELRGPGVGGIQQVSDRWVRQSGGGQDTYNSTGNWGAIPPYSHDGRDYPNGRLLFGSAPGNRPDPSFVRMMQSQGAQPSVVMDTSWLAVGHVDEFLSFLPADNERGWVLAVADPRGAIDLLKKARQDGNGDAVMLEGLKKIRYEERPDGSFEASVVPAERTVDEVLASREVRDVNESSARAIEKNLRLLRAETGLTQGEILRVPVLFDTLGSEIPGLPPEYADLAIALLPDAVNGVHLSDGTFLAAAQHGPVVEGSDPMQEAVESALDRAGVRTRWVEDYYFAHVNGGEVHCTTNALRDLSNAEPWWETPATQQ